jgi:F420-dependent methylenetetrahydromethanopterin dehydrogenase
MFSRLTTVAGTVIAGAALSAVALAGAGSAAATSADDLFLTAISSHGITYDSPQAAIKGAANVCELLSNGNSAVSVGQQIKANTDLDSKQVGYFIIDSVGVYCPQFDSKLHD